MKRNPSQQRAIAHLSGPMMVLAGPGSGKTSVIVERTAYMTTEGGISPSNILVVTFSRAAAKEMKERFLNFTGQEYTPITFGTFHGVFYGILKQAYGFTAANILSEEEKSAILRELALNHGGELAEEGDFSEEVAKEISVVKGNRISLEYYYSSCCPDEVFRQIYREYVKTCQARRKLDFDDMILCCYELFSQRPDILNAWSIYLLILVLIILTSPLFPGLRHTLENNWITKISLPINASTVNYTISWLTHAGVLLFVGTFIGGLIQGAKVKDLFTVLWNTVKQLKKTFVTVICLVGLSTIMDASGMIAVIATALATATGSLYPLFAPVIGCLGTFITGSDTSSNILFGKLQASVAGQIHVSPDWLSAANTVGATGGKIISPQSIAIATSAGNQQGKEGEILKAAIPYALTYVLITGIIVYIFS